MSLSTSLSVSTPWVNADRSEHLASDGGRVAERRPDPMVRHGVPALFDASTIAAADGQAPPAPESTGGIRRPAEPRTRPARCGSRPRALERSGRSHPSRRRPGTCSRTHLAVLVGPSARRPPRIATLPPIWPRYEPRPPSLRRGRSQPAAAEAAPGS